MKSKFQILRSRITSRGGGIEISLSPYGYKDQKMTTYCNYLGGGMLGGIQNDCTIFDWRNNTKLTEVSEELNQVFAELLGIDYEFNQGMPSSAY